MTIARRRRRGACAALLMVVLGAVGQIALAPSAHAEAPRRAPGSTDASPAGVNARAAQKLDTDLRFQAAEIEKRLQTSARLVRDGALTAMVRELGCAVTGPACADVRFYVVREPSFNAAMYPNGMAVVHTGLLLRVETESELAFILGHEFTHYKNRHSVQEAARLKSGMAAANIFSIALAIGGAGDLSSLAYLPVASAAAQFSQDMEREADLEALAALRAAGYDAQAAVRSFTNMNEEDLASSDPKRRKAAKRNGLFASHPLTRERIDYLKAAIADTAPSPPAGASLRRGGDPSAFRARIRPMLADWLGNDLAARDTGATLTLLDRLAPLGEDKGVLAFYRGETYRVRAQEGDLERAATAYAEAVTYPDAPPAAWRQLGVARQKQNQPAAARAAFARYLALTPDAPDAALIAQSLATLPPEPTP